MIEANYTIFKFYLTLMGSFSEYLSHKYVENSSENTDHYRTVVIQKIVRMFHTLEMLAKENRDEASARCVLRGILDSVAIYCFIYERGDENDMLFRYYLYALDGLKSYERHVVNGIMEKDSDGKLHEFYCTEFIKQLEYKLSTHPYSKLGDENVEKIIQNANWRYESLQKPKKVDFKMMYERLGFDNKIANYYQSYLSQYAHGLFFSNTSAFNSEHFQIVLYESILLADRMVGALFNTFPKDKEKMWNEAWRSGRITNMIKQQDFNINQLSVFVRSLIKNDRTLLI